jgi:Excalibur calcium-binding domain
MRKLPSRRGIVRALLVVLPVAAATALVPGPAAQAATYANCSDVWRQIGRPIFPQDSGYNLKLDADHDGVGCEQNPGVPAKTPPAPRRHSVASTTYSHLANPARGQARADSWVQETFSTWQHPVRVQGVARAVKLPGAARVQVDATRLEDSHGAVWARNATAVNSGSGATATQSTPSVAVRSGACGTLRVRSSMSIRWTDGGLSRVSVVGPFTRTGWCRL